MGWARKRNGELLALAAGKFEVFLTADRNLSHQQDVSSFDIPQERRFLMGALSDARGSGC